MLLSITRCFDGMTFPSSHANVVISSAQLLYCLDVHQIVRCYTIDIYTLHTNMCYICIYVLHKTVSLQQQVYSAC
jgi:hypothetical protein